MKTIFVILTAGAAVLFSSCSTETPTRDMAEPRDPTSPLGTITEDLYLR